MLIQLSLFMIGLGLIVKGGNWFVGSSVEIARALRVPKFLIGATIVSLATTAPEFTTSILAAIRGHPDVAFGNAVGSAICNIGLILGLTWLLGARIAFSPSHLPRAGFMLGAGVLSFGLTALNLLDYRGAIPLFGLLLLYFWYAVRSVGQGDLDGPSPDRAQKGLLRPALFFLVGAASVVLGSKLLVDTGVALARAFGVSELVIGLSLVSVGTSLPELVTGITSLIKGHAELSLGNIIGADFLDLAWVLGGSSLIRHLPVSHQSLSYNLPVMLLLMAVLTLFILRPRGPQRGWGGLFLTIYVVYLAGLFLIFR